MLANEVATCEQKISLKLLGKESSWLQVTVKQA